MTPGARVAAAIEIIDDIHEGSPAEQALTAWSRRSRFAGSKDRAAVRDYVFSTLRNWRSDALVGGSITGRGRMIGRLRAEGAVLEDLFTGAGHAPVPLSETELAGGQPPEAQSDKWDLPEWLVDLFEADLGDKAEINARALRTRAPITVRVNLASCSVDEALAELEAAGITAVRNPLCDTALTLTDGERKLRNSEAYQNGHVELQDAASQAIVATCPEGAKVLDYCAGGGGKALGLAALGRQVTAHDIRFERMSDLPARAERAHAKIELLATDMVAGAAPFDLVLVDAPCSGSGTWRRSPEAKWTLTPERLAELNGIQDQILDEVVPHVGPNGTLVYATCSLLKCENEDRIAVFLERHPEWKRTHETRFDVSDQGDGFFVAHLMRT